MKKKKRVNFERIFEREKLQSNKILDHIFFFIIQNFRS